MKELLEYLITNITGTEDFEISESSEGDRENFEIIISKDYIGMVIGKEGSTIRSIRKIISVKATLENKLVNISVSER